MKEGSARCRGDGGLAKVETSTNNFSSTTDDKHS